MPTRSGSQELTKRRPLDADGQVGFFQYFTNNSLFGMLPVFKTSTW